MTSLPTFSADPDSYPDPTGRAERICRFLECLRLWEGKHAGERFPLRPWQRAVIRAVYGPTAPNGKRLVRTVAMWIPRGNGKTTLCAGLGAAHFVGPESEAGGQVVMAAADQENAGIAFNSCWKMIQTSPRAAARVRPMASRKKLTHLHNASTLKAISSEAYSKHGLNVSFFLADEIHSWSPAEARPLFKTVTDSMVKREQPLTFMISTAGAGQGGLAWDWWDYSHKVARGEIVDPTFVPIIFAAPPDADWRDEAVWTACNPAIADGFCSIDELRIKARRIEHFPAEVADFKRFHLNIWTEGAAEPWVSLDIYDQAEPTRDDDDLVGEPCWVGVDLSSVEDLTAVVAVFRDDDGPEPAYDVRAKFFLPSDNIARKSEEDRASYLKWAEAGHLVLTEGNRVDYRVVTDHIIALAERHDIQEVAIDRWNSTAVTTALADEDITVAEHGQGFAGMSAPMKALKGALLGGKFRHGGNPLLRLCFANAVADKDPAENEKLTKARSRGRIDGAVAACMALGRAAAGESTRSIYDDADARPGGLLIL
ncbi:phage terminase large subunit-like protein [Azospirillum lipoferum]|uniref:Terminase large subunit n=1 Tax=Azospirillum lipoferum TaxID=193 RepID=A0A5A9GUY5_AZOLI|nr:MULTISPECIES: terminase TerL endonuclease subunit [Azospirillum]KAA0597209.1 terminase large subunit [Azospirillum lipoferum]MCP1608720.1 phage terminase large subunit-like protein [Azospirillum lipoferum]MDW5535962.1 terminase TerL endonuclease subunit [Azospirillum sp. NL1]